MSRARPRLLGALALALLAGGAPGSAAAAAAPPAPVVAAVPGCGPAATTVSETVVPYTIQVIGRNLGIYGVSIVFNPGPSERRFPGQPDEAGSLNQTIRVAPVPPGSYTIQVQDLDNVPMASTLFVVPCPPPPPRASPSPSVPPRTSPPPRVLNPTLALTPPVGPPGTIVTARGADFPPGAPVQLSWNHGIAGTTTVPVTTDASGGFTTTVLVFPHDALGARVLTAVSVPPPNSSQYGFASASFLVVAGAVQPSDFSWRR